MYVGGGGGGVWGGSGAWGGAIIPTLQCRNNNRILLMF